MMIRGLFVLAPLALLASACTTSLQTARPGDGIAKGYTYQLPRLAYDVEITRVLTRCPDGKDPALQFAASAKAASRTAAGETIVIDYLSLANGFKTSDITLKNHPNGMLQSVNLTVNDHTADILKEGVKAVVGIGKIAIGIPGGGLVLAADGVPPPPYLRCTKPTRETLDGLPKQKAAVEAADKVVKKAAKTLADFEAAHPETPRPAKVAEQASKLIATSRVAASNLDAEKEALAKSQAALTLVARHTLELDPSDPTVSPLSAAQDGKAKPSSLLEILVSATGNREVVLPLDNQLEPDFDNATHSGWGPADAGAQAINQLRSGAARDVVNDALKNLPLLDVQIASAPLVRQLGDSALPQSATCASGSSDCGVIYRTPAPGRLRICWRPGGRDVSHDDCMRSLATAKHVLFAEDRTVPQYGVLASLPFHNGSFANNTLAAEFAEDGRMVTFSYKKPNSEVQAALASANEGIGGLTELITYSNGAQLRKLQEQKAINEAALGEQESRAKLSPTEVELLARQTAVIDSQIALAAAQGRSQPSEVTAIDNERLLIEAQIRRAQKIIELRKINAELAGQAEQPTSEN